MKKILLVFLFIISNIVTAQDYLKDFSTVVEAETHAAGKIINNTRNMNTGNYDIKYHRLELTVDQLFHLLKERLLHIMKLKRI